MNQQDPSTPLSANQDFPFVIREATPADAESVVRFNRLLARESEHIDLSPAVLSAGVRAALSDRARAVYYVADADRVVIGQTMITTEWSDWRNGWYWWIQSVYVEPAFRRKGVFRALHGHIRRLAEADLAVCGLRLYVHNGNDRAMRTYRNLGMSDAEYRLYQETWSRTPA